VPWPSASTVAAEYIAQHGQPQRSPVLELLEQANCAVVSTLNPDGSVLDTVAWIRAENGTVAVDSAKGRHQKQG
jgi:hypothetical protein